jgi:hypothetical protein
MRASLLAPVAITTALILGAGAGAPAAYAAAAVRLGKIQYDSPGKDDRSNASLNAEWVTIANHSGSKKTLTGWTLRDTSSHVYRFPSFTLVAGASVRVHTGNGTDGAHNLYWGSGNYIWNNTGDKATLKTKAGTTLDTCSWGGSGSGSVDC